MNEVITLVNEKVFSISTKMNNSQYFKKTYLVLIGHVEFLVMIIKLLIQNKMKYQRNINYYHDSISKSFNFLRKVEYFVDSTNKINLRQYNFSALINEFKLLLNQIDIDLFKSKNMDFLQVDDKIYDVEYEELNNFLEICFGSIHEYSKLRMVVSEIIAINEYKKSKFVDSMTISLLTNEIVNDDKKVTKGLAFSKNDFDSEKKLKFVIWERLNNCRNIWKFYGINFELGIAVFEKAELGDLRSLYSNKAIPWPTKLQLAIGICKGIIFLHLCKMYHQNIRCSNVLVSKDMTPKLINFEFSAHLITEQKPIMVNWHSPEKLKQKITNDYLCDIFSFGMTLWELAFERIPYKDLSFEEIFQHVATNREREVFYDEISDVKQEKELYFEVVTLAWRDDPLLRPTLQNIFLKLIEAYSLVKHEKLALNTKEKGCKFMINPDSKFTTDEFKIGSVTPITVEIGIAAHKGRNYKLAYDCFEYHAKLECPLAMYWKGYYLFEGKIGEKNTEKAREFFKKAADFGLADSQLRYAFSLMNNNKQIPKEFEESFVKYIKLAADNGNETAQYNLGDMYIKGKFVNINIELGLYYINLAAIKNHPNAIDYLKL